MAEKYWHLRQNNSHGLWARGMPQHAIIKADSIEEANYIAEANGVYFDGIAFGQDCSCCGDRWRRLSEDYDDPYLSPDALRSFIGTHCYTESKDIPLWESASQLTKEPRTVTGAGLFLCTFIKD